MLHSIKSYLARRPDQGRGPSPLLYILLLLCVCLVWTQDVNAKGFPFAHDNLISSVKFSPNGQQLVSGSWDKTVKLWDVRTGQLLKTFRGHSADVLDVAFSSDSRTLASGGEDGTVRLWDARTGAELHKWGALGIIRTLAFSPDHRILLAAGEKNVIYRWDLTQANPGVQKIKTQSETWALAFFPASDRFLTGADGRVTAWQLNPEQPGKSFACGDITALAISPVGSHLAVASGTVIEVYDSQTFNPGTPLKGTSMWSWNLAFSADGKYLVSGSGYDFNLWDVATGKLLHKFTGDTATVNAVAFSPDGSMIASGSEDQSLRLWDVKTGQVIRFMKP